MGNGIVTCIRKMRLGIIFFVMMIIVTAYANVPDSNMVADSGVVENDSSSVNGFLAGLSFSQIVIWILKVLGAWGVGRGLELWINRAAGLGFRAVPFEMEVLSTLLVCHELTVFVDNLGMFDGAKGKYLKKFVKYLKKRHDKGISFKPVKLIYRDIQNTSEVAAIRRQIEEKLKTEDIVRWVEFVKWNYEYPRRGYFGFKNQPITPSLNWFRLRYWIRYSYQDYYSGVEPLGPFYPSKSQDDYEILKRYLECEMHI